MAADLIGRPEAGLSCLRLEQNEFPAQALSLRREIFGDALPRTSNAVANQHNQHQPGTDSMKKENAQKPQPQKKITLKDLKARKEVKGGVRQV